MQGNLEYIESYFKQDLNEDERTAFETKCETDKAFANEVAFYITAKQVLRETLLEQKTGEWKKDAEEETPVISIAKKSTLLRWVAYAAAACLLLTVSLFLFEAKDSPQKLASAYVSKILSQTMDASHDSLQLGIAAYNNKEYDKALQLFEGVAQRDLLNGDAKKYTGLTYLRQSNYEKALEQFDALANMQGLHSNPGNFLKAVTLLERNNPGDKDEAKILLQKVVTEKEDGSEEAAAWLKKF